MLLTFLDGENEEKVDGITTLLGNFKKRKVGSGGYLIANAMHFSCCWKKIFSSLISGECGGELRDYGIQETASFRPADDENDENVPPNRNYIVGTAVSGYQLAVINRKRGRKAFYGTL